MKYAVSRMKMPHVGLRNLCKVLFEQDDLFPIVSFKPDVKQNYFFKCQVIIQHFDSKFQIIFHYWYLTNL